MGKTQDVLEIAKRQGLVRPRDIKAKGLSREYLRRLAASGKLLRLGRGVYCRPEDCETELLPLLEVAKRCPSAVICLLSALGFHKLTTQLPHETWIAVAKGSWRPSSAAVKVKTLSLSGESFNFGIETVDIHGVRLRVYCIEKTIADCFKFRNRIGLDVAIEALKDAWRQKRLAVDKLHEAAKVCRVANIMRPYMESIIQ